MPRLLVKGLKDSADVLDYLDRRTEEIGDYLVESYKADMDGVTWTRSTWATFTSNKSFPNSSSMVF